MMQLGWSDTPRPMSGEDLAMGLRIFSDLLAAGLPLTRALRAFEEVAPPAWQPAIGPLRDAVKQGSGLSAALEQSSIGVPPIAVGIIRAGEMGGGIVAAVTRAAEHLEATESTRAALRSALAYPLIVAVVGGSAVVLMVSVVLPRFAAILAQIGQDLPWTTRTVLATAEVMRLGMLPVIAGIVVAVIGARTVLAEDGARQRFHAFLLRIPLLGSLRLSLETSRFCAALSALLESGVSIRPSLTQAAHVITDFELRSRLSRGRDAIFAGAAIGKTLGDLRAVTPTAARLASAGEETGGLGTMLSFAARIERARAERLVRSLVRLIEPTLIVAFAAIVALIAAALLQAVYSVRPA
jgi:general secretion pathway protein F